ncbi:NUDIX hydrolase [Sutcliffiella cohnii]
MRPLLRAEAIISNKDQSKFLVQCDLEESFYRLPGGSIEFGETAEEALKRELHEEFNLEIEVGILACVNENILEFDGQKRHDCTLIHRCFIDEDNIQDFQLHKEHPNIMLIWRTIQQLQQKPFYPEGILDITLSSEQKISHLRVQKNYSQP